MSPYRAFAAVFEYPDLDVSGRLDECTSELTVALPAGAELLRKFQEAHREMGTSRLQEIYTTTFDMQPDCALNLSYHLFGEDQRRGIFLAKLKELYELASVDTGTELPDHLCLMLRYVATDAGMATKPDLIADCLHPAVSKVARGVDVSNPYRCVLDALLLWLENERGNVATSDETAAGGYEVMSQRR
jgi:nitrate reductase molybdenum cofactor assembly chaperone NarJ/NarW